MMRDRRRRQIGERALFGMKMPEAVGATHQARAIDHAGRLPHVGWNVAYRQADAALGRRVWLRAVDQLDVVQRHLAGCELERDRLAGVDLDPDLLSAAQ